MRLLTMGKNSRNRQQTKKHTLTNPYSGHAKYYGRGRKSDVSLENFQDQREKYWTDVGDKWLRGHRKDKQKETSNHDVR